MRRAPSSTVGPARCSNITSRRDATGARARLGVSQPRIVELESGEKNPQIETLVKVAAATGLEFTIDIVPVGREPRLVGKAVKGRTAHIYAGASLRGRILLIRISRRFEPRLI
ncbi:MAG: helix-turn-helix domain-containing protein [Solirubrobacteraceae bacterium]